MPPAKKTEDSHLDDEIINVRLNREDYNTLRDMIKKQQSLSWLTKHLMNTTFVFLGGLVALIAFGEQIIGYLKIALGLR